MLAMWALNRCITARAGMDCICLMVGKYRERVGLMLQYNMGWRLPYCLCPALIRRETIHLLRVSSCPFCWEDACWLCTLWCRTHGLVPIANLLCWIRWITFLWERSGWILFWPFCSSVGNTLRIAEGEVQVVIGVTAWAMRQVLMGRSRSWVGETKEWPPWASVRYFLPFTSSLMLN